MIDWPFWFLFCSASMALLLAPGPDMIYIFSNTVAHGRKVGLAAAWGVCTGALVHLAAAVLGLSAILAASAAAFSAVKYAGAAYLVYLGIRTFRAGGIPVEFPAEAGRRGADPWRVFRQGVLVDVLNPKVALFYLAFLPQFVRPGMGRISTQVLVLGLLLELMAVLFESALVLAAGWATGFLRANPSASVWIDRALGTVFVALGVRLAFARR